MFFFSLIAHKCINYLSISAYFAKSFHIFSKIQNKNKMLNLQGIFNS